MNSRKQIGKSLAALLLLIAIMLPTAIQFSHTFEEHDVHIPCNEVSTHFHQSDSDCSICDFHLASFNYDIAKYPELSAQIIPVKIIKDFSSLQFHSFITTNTQLRAPPIFS